MLVDEVYFVVLVELVSILDVLVIVVVVLLLGTIGAVEEIIVKLELIVAFPELGIVVNVV